MQTADTKTLAALCHRRGGVYPHPTCYGVATLILVRRCYGWDEPSPYGGCVQHIDNQHVVNVILLQGRSSWPSDCLEEANEYVYCIRSSDRISAILPTTTLYLSVIGGRTYPYLPPHQAVRCSLKSLSPSRPGPQRFREEFFMFLGVSFAPFATWRGNFTLCQCQPRRG